MTPPVDWVPHRWQLDAAQAFEDLGGVFIGLDPGVGKTFALALILRRAQRGLLLTPAPRQAVAQLRSYGVEAYEAARPPPGGGRGVAVATYAWLTRAGQAEFFETYRPDVVAMDEYHLVRGLGHTARRRLERYLVANPAVRVAVATGSPMSGRLHDFAYGLTWSLRARVRHLVPPLSAGLDALDEHLSRSASARADFRRRLLATPGVFMDVEAGQYPGRVELSLMRPPGGPAARLPDTWELPGAPGAGVLIQSAAHAAEVDRQLAWGYYLDYPPGARPSQRYLDARRRWGGLVRGAVLSGLADTEVQVRDLEPDAYARWQYEQRREGPVADTEPVWLPEAERLLRWVVDQQLDGTPPTLVWARHRALQAAVARELDAPLHREGCRDPMRRLPQEHSDPRHVVLSVDSCYQALDGLQHRYSHNLVLELGSDPEVYKQLVARTARQGQPEDRVGVQLVVNGPGAAQALRTAVARARLVLELTGKSSPLLTLDEKELATL